MDLFDLYQQRQIGDASARAADAKGKADQLRYEVNALKRKADTLTLACQALWEIVRSQAGISDEVLLAKMQEIDARDGRLDGKISGTLVPCPTCGRNGNAARKTCLYCGTEMPVRHVFEKA